MSLCLYTQHGASQNFLMRQKRTFHADIFYLGKAVLSPEAKLLASLVAPVTALTTEFTRNYGSLSGYRRIQAERAPVRFAANVFFALELDCVVEHPGMRKTRRRRAVKCPVYKTFADHYS